MTTAILNIGLDTPSGARQTSNGVFLALQVAINGPRPVPLRWVVKNSTTEPTLVVEIDRPLTRDEAYAVSDFLRQDCIAQRVGDAGELIGPRADEWGAFNPDLFLDFGDK